MRLVSLFVDIGRFSFKSQARSLTRYFEDFANGIAMIECEIVVFGDKASIILLEEFLRVYKPRAKVVFLPLEFGELPFFALQDRVQEALEGPAMRFYSTRDSLLSAGKLPLFMSREFIRRIGRSRNDIWSHLPIKKPQAPEYLNANYLQVTWAKTWVTLRAFELGLAHENEPLVFADFGLGHSHPRFKDTVKNRSLTSTKILPAKVSLTQRGSLEGLDSAWSLAEKIDDAVIPAGVFAGDFEALLKMHQFIEISVVEHLEMGLLPDDQVLFALFAAQNPQDVTLMPALEAFNGWYQIEHFLLPKHGK